MDSDNVNDEIVNIIDAGDNEEDVNNEATEINVNDCMDETFLNSSQSDNTSQEQCLLVKSVILKQIEKLT